MEVRRASVHPFVCLSWALFVTMLVVGIMIALAMIISYRAHGILPTLAVPLVIGIATAAQARSLLKIL